jgi:hypothetical protein
MSEEKKTEENEEFPKMIRMNEGRAKNLELLREEWKPVDPNELLHPPENNLQEKKK